MLNVVVVDDERLALERMKKLLMQVQDVETAGLFLTSEELILHLMNNDTDVVFLDIELTGMNGISLAEWIMNVKPNVQIVFTTAYASYAVKAFELDAKDYLLKPISLGRLNKAIDRIKETKMIIEKVVEDKQDSNVVVRCFGHFRVSGDGGKTYIKWRNSKSEELFAMLIQYKGKPLSKDEIIEKLWSESYPGDKASTNLNTVVYQMRKSLDKSGVNDLIESIKSSGSYHINIDRVECDLYEFDRQAKIFKNSGSCEAAEKMLNLYEGEYLSICDYTWAETNRWFYDKTVSDVTERLYEKYYEKNQREKMEDLFIRMIDLNLINDENYQKFSKHYNENDFKALDNIKRILEHK